MPPRKDDFISGFDPEPEVKKIAPTLVDGPYLSQFAGMDAAKAWGESFIQDWREFIAGRIVWEDIDRGCVVHGPPGTGKTTFARALAAQARIPVIITSYAEWLCNGEGHLGDVMQAIKATFNAAREHGRCMIFIDELDSVSRRDRTSQHSEWHTGIINALLAELDGAISREGIVVIGACNHVDRVDPALLRPGRLETLIEIPKPNLAGLAGILQFHLRKSVEDVSSLAVLCQGMTGADVMQICRDARRLARRQRKQLHRKHVTDAIEAKRPRYDMIKEWRIAVHEAGHAVCAIGLDATVEVNVSVVQLSAGILMPPDKFLTSSKAIDQIAVMLAGRAAEELILGEATAGAGGGKESDLAAATDLAYAMIADYGIYPDHLTWFADSPLETHMHKDSDVASEVESILSDGYDRAKAAIRHYKDAVIRVANALLRFRALTYHQLLRIIDSTPESPQPA